MTVTTQRVDEGVVGDDRFLEHILALAPRHLEGADILHRRSDGHAA